jgi:hypothetical protein
MAAPEPGCHGGKRATAADLLQLKELVSGYRVLARDVSLARTAAPDAL